MEDDDDADDAYFVSFFFFPFFSLFSHFFLSLSFTFLLFLFHPLSFFFFSSTQMMVTSPEEGPSRGWLSRSRWSPISP